MREYLAQLFETTIVDRLKEGALFNSLGRGNTFFGKVVLF
jgi:hypothetical protein